MNPLQAQAKAFGDLIDRINNLKESKILDQLAIRRLKTDAGLQLQNAPRERFMILGIAAGLEQDSRKARQYFKQSLQLKDDHLGRVNFARTLTDLMFSADAVEQFNLAIQDMQAPSYIQEALEPAVKAGKIKIALQYLNLLDKITTNLADESFLKRREHLEMIVKTGVSEKDIFEMHSIAEDIAREHDSEIIGTRIWKDETEEPYTVHHDFLVEPEQLEKMSSELINRLFDTGKDAMMGWDYQVHFSAKII